MPLHPARKIRPRQARAEVRRQEILLAALESFSELGYASATMADICQRSGASTGSVYHLFGSKEQLAAELYIEGVARYQHGFLSLLEAGPRARDGIYALVRYHLGWVRDHADWSRYLLQMRRAEFLVFTEAQMASLNDSFDEGVGAWLTPHVQRGTVRQYASDLFTSILLGPCQEYAGQWLAGHAHTAPERAARELGRAVWRALATTPC